MSSAAPSLAATMFDGRSAAGRAVRLQVEGNELVAHADDGSQQRWPLAAVRWPERTRHGQRVLHVASGEWLQCADLAAFDAWAAASGRRDSWLVRVQQNWRLTVTALVLLVLVIAAGYQWGVPLAARAVLVLLPAEVDRAVGAAVMKTLDEKLFAPTRLPPARQQALREAFAQAMARAHPLGGMPPHRVEFRHLDEPNAAALPGGTLIVTDTLVQLLEGRDEVVVGVLAHELGHVQRRHGMRLLVQATLVAAAVGMVIGDFSSVLAGAPALLAQMSYARDLEREADADCARLLRAAGIAPAVMVEFFDRLPPATAGGGLPLGLASHPGHEERKRFFRETAQR